VNVATVIGNTPLVEIKRLNGNNGVKIYAKLEGCNPGGSVKDRAVKYMVELAERSGELKQGMKIVEPSSGNTGIAVAMIGALKGYDVTIVMPESMSVERRKIVKSYGAELVLTSAAEGMDGAIKVAERMAKEGYFMLDQFKNQANILAHYGCWKKVEGGESEHQDNRSPASQRHADPGTEEYGCFDNTRDIRRGVP
jgi:cysteine synthase